MLAEKLLYEALLQGCPYIHETRINVVIEVSQALRTSTNLSLSALGRKLKGLV